jgi:hypothetical protein
VFAIKDQCTESSAQEFSHKNKVEIDEGFSWVEAHSVKIRQAYAQLTSYDIGPVDGRYNERKGSTVIR